MFVWRIGSPSKPQFGGAKPSSASDMRQKLRSVARS
jgi:hypothetical protein